MPARSSPGQAQAIQDSSWFRREAGVALLDSEVPAVRAALADTRGLSWLWLGPCAQQDVGDANVRNGLQLHPSPGGGWTGAVRCGLPLPLPSESLGLVILQHVDGQPDVLPGLLDECARVLAPGGRVLVFALNPVAPYRWRWRGSGEKAVEPLTWRRRLRRCGLTPGSLSEGLGPSWKVEPVPGCQSGAGLRAAYLLWGEKRRWPLTPVRKRHALQLEGAGAR